MAPAGPSYLPYLRQTGHFFYKGTRAANQDVKHFIARSIFGVDLQGRAQGHHKAIAIINISPSTLNKDAAMPKIDIDGLFAGIYYGKGDEWQVFNILVPGSIPSAEKLA